MSSEVDAEVLEFLEKNGPHSQTQIRESLSIKHSTMNACIHRLKDARKIFEFDRKMTTFGAHVHATRWAVRGAVEPPKPTEPISDNPWIQQARERALEQEKKIKKNGFYDSVI